MKPENRIVVVTGTGSVALGWGIGKACSMNYARAGARVVAVDISAEATRETASIVEREGGQCMALAAHVSDSHAVSGVAEEIRAAWGSMCCITTLVPNWILMEW